MLQVPANAGWRPEFKLSGTPPFLAGTNVLRLNLRLAVLSAGLGLCFAACAGLEFDSVLRGLQTRGMAFGTKKATQVSGWIQSQKPCSLPSSLCNHSKPIIHRPAVLVLSD